MPVSAPKTPSATPRGPLPGQLRARPRAALALALLLLAAGLLTGCAHMSVRHLARTPWTMGQQEEVTLKYWRFVFVTTPETDRFRVRGTAYPLTEDLPKWADWIDELWLSAYVADKNGGVVTDDLRVYLPGPFDPTKGVPFDFTLKPDRLESGQLFITFGYRMALGQGKPADGTPDPKRRIFFANERAMDFF
ncbi:putative lipoprotein [Desulfovibrio sp. X2]|uniref:hypothetical protein n=1 Tax=Desulfovibrio sp. X2 TaxID=941449 RepID=UPI000358DEC6|nr:hypothetical protein [Desulfovibrio sp. X2]EPR41930.1 putative lipoprotein [Desulfovibrio sp. X2]